MRMFWRSTGCDGGLPETFVAVGGVGSVARWGCCSSVDGVDVARDARRRAMMAGFLPVAGSLRWLHRKRSVATVCCPREWAAHDSGWNEASLDRGEDIVMAYSKKKESKPQGRKRKPGKRSRPQEHEAWRLRMRAVMYNGVASIVCVGV